jgi:hypothetical protein
MFASSSSSMPSASQVVSSRCVRQSWALVEDLVATWAVLALEPGRGSI